jgi:hypothetical protein
LFHLYTFYNLLLLRVCRLQYFKGNTYTWKVVKILLKIKWNFVMVFKTNCKMFSTYSLAFSLGFNLKRLGGVGVMCLWKRLILKKKHCHTLNK